MIVFCVVIGIICIIQILLISSIQIDVQQVEIEKIDDLKNICNYIKRKRYDKVFDYFKIKIKVRLVLFTVLPIVVLNIDDRKIKKIAKKIMLGEIKQKRKNLKKYIRQMEKRERIIQKLKKNIPPYINIENLDINVYLGLTEAGVTAIATGIVNIMISIMLMWMAELMFEKQDININKDTMESFENINYDVRPIYSKEFVFSLVTNCKLKIPIYSIV